MTLTDAHKTGRKYRRFGEKGFYHYGSGNFVPRAHALADDWEVEPEVYEVECGWVRELGERGYVNYPKIQGRTFFKQFEGKRTKLTIEVLD